MRRIEDMLVFCDVDNTLLHVQKGLPLCNKEVIGLFNLLGGRFTLATGRTPDSVRAALDGLKLSAPAVCCGGAVLYDFEKEKPLFQASLDIVTAKKAIEDALQKFPGIGVEVMANCGQIYILRANRYTLRHLKDEKIGCTYCPVSQMPQQWEKVLFAADSTTTTKLKEYMEAGDYGDSIHFVHTNATYFEIMPGDVSKASGMKRLCRMENVLPQNTVMIGDYYNDIEPMRACGTAVAVANAPQEVKMAADIVTNCRCFEGGVGEYLYSLIKECGC